MCACFPCRIYIVERISFVIERETISKLCEKTVEKKFIIDMVATINLIYAAPLEVKSTRFWSIMNNLIVVFIMIANQ